MQTITITLQKIQKLQWLNAIVVVLGSVFLALLSQVSIPLPGTPVPLTLQTLGVFILGGTLGSKRSALSIVLYLLQGTLGLPVFAGGVANPLWLFGPQAGFLLSFIPAAILIGRFGKGILSLTLAQCVISFVGMFWLYFYLGNLKTAFFVGVVPFLPGAGIKIAAGTMLLKSYELIRRKS